MSGQSLPRESRRRLFGCAKRGCDAVNPGYLSFGAGGKGYCLGHIPWRYRLKVWWQERSSCKHPPKGVVSVGTKRPRDRDGSGGMTAGGKS